MPRGCLLEVVVEAIRPHELELASKWLSEPHINRWLNSTFRGRTVSPRVLELILTKRENRLFTIKFRGEACGLVGFSDVDEVDRLANLWYLLGDRTLSGHGITSAAVGAALEIAFGEMALVNVRAWVTESNHASRRVLEKCHFRVAGRLRQAGVAADGREDRVYFDILADDFKGRA